MMAQQGEIIPLSQNVGTIIDAEENAILGLFPDISGFQSAQIYELGINKYVVKIVRLDHTLERTSKQQLNWNELQRLKQIADNHPVISDDIREEYRYKLSYLHVYDLLTDIPDNSYSVLKHINGRRISGAFIRFKGQTVTMQTPTSRISVPLTDIESIIYRPVYRSQNEHRNKIITYAFTGLAGFGVGELWNLQSAPKTDIIWHNRFIGTILGVLAGSEIFEAVTIVLSPKKIIAFTPEEIKRAN